MLADVTMNDFSAREDIVPVEREHPTRLPGDAGLWFFIVADMVIFAIFFLVFSVGRVQSPELYEQSRLHLDANIGLANTLILLTSSMFMVRAVDAARAGLRGEVRRNLVMTMGVGSLFILTKVFEYGTKIASGITMLTNEFFTYYFVFTGIHFLHFAVGIGALAFCFAKAGRDRMDQRFVIWCEGTGCYWHLVDLLWIMLFPMLYLLRAG